MQGIAFSRKKKEFLSTGRIEPHAKGERREDRTVGKKKDVSRHDGAEEKRAPLHGFSTER